MRLIPAPAGSGIVFRRSDLDNYEIPATGRNVAKVSYATSLMRQGVLISTTEHLLSAFIGLGVDNVIVEIDNLEVPILDGSSLPYVEAILATGLKRQRRRREYLRILKDVEVRDGSKFIGVYPGSGYQIDYRIDFPAPIGADTFVGDLEAGAYASLIAPARTFGFRQSPERPAALPGRVRPPQGARPDWRSSSRWPSHLGPRCCRARRPRDAYRAGPAPSARPLSLGTDDADHRAAHRA